MRPPIIPLSPSLLLLLLLFILHPPMTDTHAPIEPEDTLVADLLPARIGKDELNLTEFPIALLSSRGSESQKTLEFSDTIRGENNKPVKRQWIVTGSDKFGLPVSGDEDIILSLLEATKDDGFASRMVPISRYDIIERLGIPHTGPSYQRVKEALDRLAGVQIYARNAFWDKTIKRYTSVSFGILEGYVLVDETPGRKTEQLKFKHLSSITWNEIIFKSFLAGNLKSLNLNRYFTLRSATARRLYRYLDKKFYDQKGCFEINLFRLAYERLGMSRSRRYPSQVKEKLAQAHEELIRCGFLDRVEYRSGTDGTVAVYYPGKGEKAIPPRRRTSRVPRSAQPEPSPLLQQLLDQGVGKSAAARFVQECPDEVARQLEYLPYVPPKDIKTTVGAYLTAAIRDGYGAPAGYLKAQRMRERGKRRRNTDAREKENPPEDARLTAIRARLSPEELETVEREAVEAYFVQFPHMRRTLEKRMDDPEQRRKVAGSAIDTLLVERYGETPDSPETKPLEEDTAPTLIKEAGARQRLT